jgi:Holliday junction DNA helicase RuvA
LFGFFDKSERNLFRKLISVSGIGASTARTMLSSLNPQEIQRAILTENVSTIQSVKGIGLKTAQRVIIELKDKVNLADSSGEISISSLNQNREEALSALEVLGYSRKQTSKVVDELINNDPEISVEKIIKNSLNKL